MAGATSKLSILIDAKNNASPVLKQVANDAQSASGSVMDLGEAFGLALSAGGIMQAGKAVYDLAEVGAQAEELGKSFNKLAMEAGQSGNAMLSSMHEASQGMISDTDLMLAANKAMLLGVANTGDEMAGLMKVATARGKAMGESATDAFSDIITGVGRLSPMILDNLGITVDAAAAYETYAKSLGVAADALDENQKKQALVNDILKNSAGLVDDAGGRGSAGDMAALSTSMDNLKTSAGQLIAVPVAFWARGASAELDAQKNDLDLLKKGFDMAFVAAKNFATGGHEVTNAVRDMAIAEGQADAVTHNLTFGLNNAGDAAAAAGPKLRAMGADALAAMDSFNAAMSLSQSIAGQISSAASQSGALFGSKQGGDAGLARQKAVGDELKSQNQTWLDMHYTQKQIDDVLMPAYISNLRDADQATFKVATGTAKISDEARAAQQAFDDLTNTVSGVLQGALDPGVGINPDDLLPRADAINEDARRLADVAVNGWASPWAEYFRTAFPEQFQEMAASNDIKTGAAIMLRNFQDGLEPELIDKEAAKERVRKMLIGDQNMADLAKEIATELSAEMGVPMQDALAAAQGSLGGSGGAGTEAATSFADGASAALDSTDGGGAFVTKFKDQMVAQYGLLKTAGTEAGKQWGDAFLAKVGDSVPQALIDMLTTLITPQVIAALAQKGSLTGATP